MKILITGANGALGTSICDELAKTKHQVFKTNRHTDTEKHIRELDICNRRQVDECFKDIQPDLVFHLAAETRVDYCQENPQHAYNVNTIGTANIGIWCSNLNIPIVYISTGQVFDGKQLEYVETSKVRPINQYAITKYWGERIVTSIPKHFIFRISWVTGSTLDGNKFIGKMLAQIQNGQTVLDVVDDKFGSPTFTADFARNVLAVINTEEYGIYHMANKGSCSRFELMQEIIQLLEIPHITLNPVSSTKYVTPAPRPEYEVLRSVALHRLKLNNMLHWKDALKELIWSIKKTLNIPTQ